MRKITVAVMLCVACVTIPAAFFLTVQWSPRVQAEGTPTGTAVNPKAEVQPASGTATAGTLTVKAPKDMEKSAENETLVLFVNKTTAEIAVGDKRSGKIWFSSPPDRESDKTANPYEHDSLGSLFGVTYSDSVGNSKTFMSYNDAAKKKQVTIQSIEGGIKAVYVLGDNSAGIDVLPKLISQSRMDQFMGKLDKENANYVYRKYNLNKGTGIYERFDTSLNDVALKRVTEAFQAAGYTAEDLAKENADNQVKADGANDKAVFTIPLQIKLDGEHLLATIPLDEIKEPQNNSITRIELNKYFAAAGLSDQGYMLVPGGSGSLIRLNNGKSKDDIYSQSIYGADEAIRKRVKDQNEETARLPVFGLKSGDAAMYGIIEQGSAIASVNAEVSGRTNSYNYVYSSFAIRNKDELPLGNGQTFNYISIMQSQRAKGNISVRYGFLYGQDADYAGMAKAYQGYLVRQSGLNRQQAAGDLPFFVDVIGSIPKQQSFLGVPYVAMEPLTTFGEAQAIAEQLKASQVGNIKMRYLGWFNDGVDHKLPTQVSVDSELGGKAGLAKLSGFAKANGVELYPDVSFLNVFHNTFRFSPSRQASRYMTRYVVEKLPYDPAFLRMNPFRNSYFLLSPSALPGYVDSFLSKYEKLGIQGLSLRYMGSGLNPDYRVERIYDREESAKIVSEQLKKLQGRVPGLMVTGGNAYALAYAKALVDVPLKSTAFNITDESVPFYQMVVHGFVPYAGPSFNLADNQDVRSNLLKAAEYGSNIRFTWIYGDPSAVKETDFDHLYSVHYKTWFTDAVEAYNKLNAALKDVQNVRMSSHTQVQDGVYATGYENGKTVYVNYTNQPVVVSGVRIDANDFAVGGGQP